MAVYKRGKVWWFKFAWRGTTIRESSKSSNKRIAEQIESARKAALAKGEVGIRDRGPAPTLARFAADVFLPHVAANFADKPSTRAYYRIQAGHLTQYSPLGSLRIDSISVDAITRFVEQRRRAEYEVSSVNRSLQVLRRMLKLAVEWGYMEKPSARISLLPGERRRERVLSLKEEGDYLDAARLVGDSLNAAYEAALTGIRATKRGQVPEKPKDPYLLLHVAAVLLDCALRPEECYRLEWSQLRDRNLHIPFGKTANARRTVPLSKRAAAFLELRRDSISGPWVFPADTKSGHLEQSTLRKQHAKACKLAGIEEVPFYTFRHTCLTRWAAHIDPYTLAYFAGHSDFGTTRRYVHPDLETARASMEKAREERGGHRIGHTGADHEKTGEEGFQVIQ